MGEERWERRDKRWDRRGERWVKRWERRDEGRVRREGRWERREGKERGGKREETSNGSGSGIAAGCAVAWAASAEAAAGGEKGRRSGRAWEMGKKRLGKQHTKEVDQQQQAREKQTCAAFVSTRRYMSALALRGRERHGTRRRTSARRGCERCSGQLNHSFQHSKAGSSSSSRDSSVPTHVRRTRVDASSENPVSDTTSARGRARKRRVASRRGPRRAPPPPPPCPSSQTPLAEFS